jgi:hypothetical protein
METIPLEGEVSLLLSMPNELKKQSKGDWLGIIKSPRFSEDFLECFLLNRQNAGETGHLEDVLDFRPNVGHHHCFRRELAIRP